LAVAVALAIWPKANGVDETIPDRDVSHREEACGRSANKASHQ
jgi:hypothetical protein